MKPLIASLLALLAVACGGSPSGSAAYPIEEAALAEAAAGYAALGQADALPADGRKVVRTGSLGFEVDDVEAARAAVMARAKEHGGYVEGDERGEYGQMRTATLRVRVPTERFDAFVEGLGPVGRLESRRIDAADVTGEWVDMEARLAAKRAVEKRFLELAGQAREVREILEVERELGNVRAEIEGMEARMKTLRHEVAMGTLTITCTKRVAVRERFAPRFGVAVREGWNLLLRALVGAVYLWPFALILAGLIAWRRRSARLSRTRRRPSAGSRRSSPLCALRCGAAPGSAPACRP